MIFLRMTRMILLSFALVAFIASCATKPPRSSSEIKMDNAIELAVTQQLDDAPNSYFRHVDVSVYRGIVTLSGFVTERDDLAEAVRITALVPGVTSVSNQMELIVGGTARAQ